MTDSGPAAPGRGAGSTPRLRRALIALCVTQITGYGIQHTPATAPPDPTAGVDSRERTVSSTGPV